jgi:thiamine biosynthesis protein ThiS
VRLRINGIPEDMVQDVVNIEEFIIGKGLLPERVVVELNLQSVPRSHWRSVPLKNDDAIEIVSFVGGG